jgi:hypothetical protein
MLLDQEPLERYLYNNFTSLLNNWILLFVMVSVLWICVAGILSSSMGDLKTVDEFKS